MIRALPALVCCAAFWGHAAVTPLPGATPQTALAGDVFPNPIRLLVTDAVGNPVPGATVQWVFPPSGYSRLWIREPSPCSRGPFDMGPTCRVTAGADGVAQIEGLYGTVAGFHELRSTAGFNGTYLGEALLEFRVEPRQPPLQFLSTAGDSRQAVIGTTIGERFAVRVLTAQGAPVQGAFVNFTPYGYADQQRGFMVDSSRPYSVTDADGYAVAPPFSPDGFRAFTPRRPRWTTPTRASRSRCPSPSPSRTRAAGWISTSPTSGGRVPRRTAGA